MKHKYNVHRVLNHTAAQRTTINSKCACVHVRHNLLFQATLSSVPVLLYLIRGQ